MWLVEDSSEVAVVCFRLAELSMMIVSRLFRLVLVVVSFAEFDLAVVACPTVLVISFDLVFEIERGEKELVKMM